MDNAFNGEAVDRIANLGRQATAVERLTVDAPGAGFGVPAIPLLFDVARGPQSLRKLFEEWRVVPERRRGTANVSTLSSFNDLTNRHKTRHSVIFASTTWPGPSLTAVIDYHEIDNGLPQFGEHRVHYAFPVTDEFTAWVNQDGKPFDQAAFAAFVEEHVAELADPGKPERDQYEGLFKTKIATPHHMVELSRGLQVFVAAQVKSHVTLQSGEGEVVFVEEHQDRKGEKITIPGLFMVSVPAFLDGDPVRIPARLRYRVREGKVLWFYQLYRWKFLLRDRVVADLAKATIETELPAYEGRPEA